MPPFDLNLSPQEHLDYGSFLTLAPPQTPPSNPYRDLRRGRRTLGGPELVREPQIQRVNSREVPRRWTDEEDRKLRRLVREIGGQWARIGRMMEGRKGKQCRERWNNHLRPDIQKHTIWSKEEEETIVEIHKKEGTKWAKICKVLHGRTENAIKNHWNSTKRKIASSGVFVESSPLQHYIGLKSGAAPWKLPPHGQRDRTLKSGVGPASGIARRGN